MGARAETEGDKAGKASGKGDGADGADGGAPLDDNTEIELLARLAPLNYERARKDAGKRLGVAAPRCSTALVSAKRAKLGLDGADDAMQGRAIAFAGAGAVARQVNGAAICSTRSPPRSGRTSLWQTTRATPRRCGRMHTYLLDRFLVSPRLAICSPVKRCGKTTLLDVLARLVLRPLPTANVTTAAIFRVVEEHMPSLLVDEADTFLHENDELRGVINSGHRRGGSVLRTVGDEHEVRCFATYSACAIAAIGRLPDTLHDRSVVIDLKRRLRDRGDRAVPYRPHRAPRRPGAADRAVDERQRRANRRDRPGDAEWRL